MKKRNREHFIKLLALMHRYLYLPLIVLLSLKVGDERCLDPVLLKRRKPIFYSVVRLCLLVGCERVVNVYK